MTIGQSFQVINNQETIDYIILKISRRKELTISVRRRVILKKFLLWPESFPLFFEIFSCSFILKRNLHVFDSAISQISRYY
jgi:hypothetical protein